MNKWVKLLISPILFYAQGATSFTGIYVDAHVGQVQTELTHNQNTGIAFLDLFNFIFEREVKATHTAMTGGFTLGYSHLIMDNIILGFETRYNADNVNTTSEFDITSGNGEVSISLNGSTKFKNDFAFLLKFGGIYDCKTLFYFFIGPQVGKFHIVASSDFFQQVISDVTMETHLTGSSRHHRWGIVYGIGVEHMILD